MHLFFAELPCFKRHTLPVSAPAFSLACASLVRIRASRVMSRSLPRHSHHCGPRPPRPRHSQTRGSGAVGGASAAAAPGRGSHSPKAARVRVRAAGARRLRRPSLPPRGRRLPQGGLRLLRVGGDSATQPHALHTSIFSYTTRRETRDTRRENAFYSTFITRRDQNPRAAIRHACEGRVPVKQPMAFNGPWNKRERSAIHKQQHPTQPKRKTKNTGSRGGARFTAVLSAVLVVVWTLNRNGVEKWIPAVLPN